MISVGRRRFKFRRAWWFIAIGFAIYVTGFTRLVAKALDTPSPIDEVPILTESDLGFVPYLVSNDPLQADQDAPSSPDDQMNVPEMDLKTPEISGAEDAGIRRNQIVAADDSLTNRQSDSLSIWLPNKLIIPRIDLEAPIRPVSYKSVEVDGKTYEQWFAPDSPTVGWHQTSAQLGSPGKYNYFNY